MALEVLVLESDQGAADAAIQKLAAAGHRVVRCHDPGAAAFPCHALQTERNCPLRARTVDVALTVRARPRSQPSLLEDGIVCALKRHVPVVAAGSTVLNPFEPYAAVVAGDDIVAACEQAASSVSPEHSRVATEALHDAQRTHGRRPAGGVDVHRSSGRLVATMHGDGLDQHTTNMAAVRVITALRALDGDAAGIDVVER